MDASLFPNRRPDYFPPAGGRYEVKPGLIRFGKALGGGGDAADGRVFQFDATFDTYRRGKLSARRERLGKYFLTERLSPETQTRLCRFIVGQLTVEHPELFQLTGDVLTCRLTHERLTFGPDMSLRSVEPGDAVTPSYACAFDALGSQVQEDLAIVSAAESEHWLSAIHLCFPNAWAAGDKIGRTFPAVHGPVAGMEQMNQQADALVQAMLNATDGLVRFAWGVTFDDELNHHPEQPPGVSRTTQFDEAHPRAFLRVERQTVWGFPDVSAALFAIRTYLYDCADIRRHRARRDALASALRSMTPESAAYKGIAASREALVDWLTADC